MSSSLQRKEGVKPGLNCLMSASVAIQGLDKHYDVLWLSLLSVTTAGQEMAHREELPCTILPEATIERFIGHVPP